jgi:hypothetical protein
LSPLQEIKLVGLAATGSNLCHQATQNTAVKFSSFKHCLGELKLRQNDSVGAEEESTLVNFERRRPAAVLHRLTMLKSACLLWHCSAISIFSVSKLSVDQKSTWESSIAGVVGNSDLMNCYSEFQNLLNGEVCNNFIDDGALSGSSESLSTCLAHLESHIFTTIRANVGVSGIPGMTKLDEQAVGVTDNSAVQALDQQCYHSLVQISYFCSAVSMIGREFLVRKIDYADSSKANELFDVVGHVDTVDMVLSMVMKHIDARLYACCKLLEDGQALLSVDHAVNAMVALINSMADTRNFLLSALDAMLSLLNSTNVSEGPDHESILDMFRYVEASVNEAARGLLDANNMHITVSASSFFLDVVDEITVVNERSALLWRWVTDPTVRSPISAFTIGNESSDFITAPCWISRCRGSASQVLQWNNAVAAASTLRSKAETAEFECMKLRDQLQSSKAVCAELATDVDNLRNLKTSNASSSSALDDEKLHKEIKVRPWRPAIAVKFYECIFGC